MTARHNTSVYLHVVLRALDRPKGAACEFNRSGKLSGAAASVHAWVPRYAVQTVSPPTAHDPPFAAPARAGNGVELAAMVRGHVICVELPARSMAAVVMHDY